MSLLEKISKARRALIPVETKVITADGRELIEKRKSDGSVSVVSAGVRPWGFVGDFKPDLEVAVVRPGIMVGGQDVAADFDLLKAHNITHILNCATLILNSFEEDFTYKRLNILDYPTTDIRQHFDDCIEFMKSAISIGGDDAGAEAGTSGGVFVHCNAGISRSVTLVVAYLMKIEGMTFEEALVDVKRVRKSARPNEGFVEQLKAYEEELRNSGVIRS